MLRLNGEDHYLIVYDPLMHIARRWSTLVRTVRPLDRTARSFP